MIHFDSDKNVHTVEQNPTIASIDEATWEVFSKEALGVGWDIIGGRFVKLMSEDQILARFDARARICELKENLSNSDYQALKFSEGVISEEEYAPIRAQRQAWRDEINRLESLLG